MNLESALFLGIVEGLTEFLPVSSTFHLIIAAKVLGLSQSEFVKTFEIVIQSGAILAVLALYARELVTSPRLLSRLAYSFVPTATVGYVLYRVIKDVFFDSSVLMLCAFFLVGIVFLAVEQRLKGTQKYSPSLPTLTWVQAVAIGLAQALAVIPGVSRAGSVMVIMLLMGFTRENSAKYSFLLALPTILGASFLDLYKSPNIYPEIMTNLVPATLGFLSAFVTSYLVMRWFIRYLGQNTLRGFGYYRLALTLIIVLTGLLR